MRGIRGRVLPFRLNLRRIRTGYCESLRPAGAGHLPLTREAFVSQGNKKQGRKNPTQHRHHITAQVSSQRPNGPGNGKSVFSTKAIVCIWETFRLEKLKNPCYLIVTKRNRKTPNPLVDYQKQMVNMVINRISSQNNTKAQR